MKGTELSHFDQLLLKQRNVWKLMQKEKTGFCITTFNDQRE